MVKSLIDASVLRVESFYSVHVSHDSQPPAQDDPSQYRLRNLLQISSFYGVVKLVVYLL